MAEFSPLLTTVQAQSLVADLPVGAAVLLLGATDVGKTTFALAVADQYAHAGRSVAVLDCDLGQSEIGPPGTVGVALTSLERMIPVRTGRDLGLIEAAFVGATSPAGHELDTVAAACRLARAAHKHNPDLLLVDTPGWVQGAATVFVRRLADVLRPQTILAFTRGDELVSLLAPFRGLQTPQVHRVSPDPAAVRKTSAARTARRALRFAAALEGASEHVLSLDQVALCGTDLFTGEPLPHHVQQFLSRSLAVPVLHAERQAAGPPYIVVNGERWNTSGVSAIAEYFRTTHVTVVPAQKFARLLIGLINNQGALLDIGLVARLDFLQRTLTVLTACRRPAAIAQVWCGFLRVRPDGRELGTLRPREL